MSYITECVGKLQEVDEKRMGEWEYQESRPVLAKLRCPKNHLEIWFIGKVRKSGIMLV